MNAIALVLLAGSFLVCLPSVSGQTSGTLEAVLTSQHAGMEMTVPENHRLDIPIEVSVKAGGFVCAQQATVTIKLIWSTEDVANYGASLEPGSGTSTITFQQAEPGTDVKGYKGTPVTLNIFWSNEVPKQGAKATYHITTDTINQPDGGPCVPQYTAKGASIDIVTRGTDVVETNSTTSPANCAMDPSDPRCQTSTPEAKGSSPEANALLMLVGGVAVVGVLRRRRA